MQDKIYEAIECWARVPTCYTGHPEDIKRFNAAMIKLYLEVGANISAEDIRQVLKKYREKTPSFWPDDMSDKKIEEYVEKILLSLKKLQ